MKLSQLQFFIILFILLVLQGLAIDLLPSSLATSDVLIVPHWLLLFLMLIALKYDRNETFYSIIYSIAFGLLIDIVYTGMLGIYMFVYPVSVYVAHILKRMFHTNILMSSIIAVITITVTEVLIYYIYTILGMIDATMSYFLLYRLLPTTLANLLFFLLIYGLFSQLLVRWSNEQLEKIS